MIKENEKELHALLLKALGEAISFSMLDLKSQDYSHIWLELQAAKETGAQLHRTIQRALDLIKKT